MIPQQVFEPVHERSLPESGYLALSNGSTGYVKVRRLQAPSLFKQRPVTFVNPPVETLCARGPPARIAPLPPPPTPPLQAARPPDFQHRQTLPVKGIRRTPCDNVAVIQLSVVLIKSGTIETMGRC